MGSHLDCTDVVSVASNGCHSFEQPLVNFPLGVLHVHIILIACERLSEDSFGLG